MGNRFAVGVYAGCVSTFVQVALGPVKIQGKWLHLEKLGSKANFRTHVRLVESHLVTI